jgi:hypothetical protein
MTAPTGQKWVAVAVEVQAASAAVFIPPPALIVRQAVRRASVY